MLQIVIIPFGDRMHKTDEVRCNSIYQNCLCNKGWWEHRANIFDRFTGKSLQAQTADDVVIVATVDPVTFESHKDCIDEVFKKYGVVTVPTIDADEALVMIAKRFAPDYGEVMHIHIDSDDMYDFEGLKQMENAAPKPGDCVIMRNGWIYDANSKQLAQYKAPTPPFFGLAFPRDVLNDVKRTKRFREVNFGIYHHEMHRAKSVKFLEGGFCVLVHGKNTSTTWENYHTKKHVGIFVNELTAKKAILSRFRIEGELDNA